LFFFRSPLGSQMLGKDWRILKAYMQKFPGSREKRACFPGPVTDSNHHVHRDIREFLYRFGTVAGDIYPSLSHDLDSPRIEALTGNPCRERFNALTFEVPSPAFGHLAAARIASTQK